MHPTASRPFYTEYAWVYDLLIDRPVQKECAVIVDWLVARDVLPGSEIVDAGCGTGRYSLELARRGYRVDGVDLSRELIDVATQARGNTNGLVRFAVADLSALPSRGYAAVLCRGVLNDIVDDAARHAVFRAFARALQPDGVLILDVREWNASAERKMREPLFRKRVSTDRGELTFTSVTTLDRNSRHLLVSERHVLVQQGHEVITEHQFVMRCWERAELDGLLASCGFGRVSYFGAYDPEIPVGATDRLVAVTQLNVVPESLRQTLLG